MSLITRCPACRTMFRVVPDQLKVSEGWVRCGQCDEVFDASANLQQEAPPPEFAATDLQVGATAAMLAPEPYQDTAHLSTQDAAHDAAKLLLHEMTEPAVAGPDSSFPHTQLDESPVVLEGGRTEPSLADPEPTPGLTPDVTGDDAPALVPEAASVAQTSLPGPDLSFVRAAQRKARWNRWPVRLALLLVALGLLGVLGVQVLWQERDRLAAHHPGLRPAIGGACELLGCEIRPLRQIDAVVIDGSAFTKLRGDVFRLSLTLRNNGPVAVAAPAVELALTDALDQPLIRRVLMPGELGARAGVIGSRAELQTTLVLSIKGGVPAERIVGYRLLAFYP